MGSNGSEMKKEVALDTATFGGGCFWCVEAAFAEVKGVHDVISGYSGGHTTNPTYKDVCTGTTGHAEVVQVLFDSDSISYSELLEIFWSIHDPTTLNRQGPDSGTQYRSVIFYHNAKQETEAREYMAQLNRDNAFPDPVITEISPFTVFYPAEEYHQDFFNRNPHHSYCQIVIRPKIDKFRKAFHTKLR
jgi:peptide-methionine (S)-S-oxide reductase